MVGQAIKRKLPIKDSHLQALLNNFNNPIEYDDHLFLTICFTAYHGLMRIGELVIPDDPRRLNIRKTILRRTVKISHKNSIRTYEFELPTSKSDQRFFGNSVLIQARTGDLDPFKIFDDYLGRRDRLFPFFPQLWVRASGRPPSRSWFTRKLRTILPTDFSGHSFRAGGATRLAEVGVPEEKIQAMGRWSSEAWRIYIRKNPIILVTRVSAPKSIFDLQPPHS